MALDPASGIAQISTAMRQLRPSPGLVRAIVVVVGALLVFQSTQDLGPLKVGYLTLATVVVVTAVVNVYRMRRSFVVASARPWLIASGIVASLVVISMPIAISAGTPVSTWLRDAAPYALFAAAPWLAVDVALLTSRRAVLALTVVVGAVATISYALTWLQRRHISDFPIDRLALPSLVLAASLFAIAVALSVSDRRHRWFWMGVASVTIATLVYSGTRASFALLIVCPTVVLASWLADGRKHLPSKVLVSVVPVLAAIAVVAAQVGPSGDGLLGGSGPSATSGAAAPATTAGPGTSGQPVPTHNLGERFESIGTVLSGQDTSLQERLSQTRAVWAVFLASPLVGGGLGVPIPWTDSKGVAHTDNAFTADTPLLVLAKFGLLGFVLIAALGWAVLTTIRSLGTSVATRQSWLATIAFTTAIIVLMPFGWQLEDKGTALATVLILAFGLIEARNGMLGSVVEPNDVATSRTITNPSRQAATQP